MVLRNKQRAAQSSHENRTHQGSELVTNDDRFSINTDISSSTLYKALHALAQLGKPVFVLLGRIIATILLYNAFK
jgi:hypothetical protein